MFLQNDKLLLRAMEPEDMDILYKWENDTEVWHHSSTLMPYSKFALKDYLENSLKGILHTHQLRIMADDKQTGKTIGTIDIYDFDPVHSRAGVGLLVDKAYRGRGLGEEMLRLCGEYAFRFLFLNQLYAYIAVNNAASYNLFIKCGYRRTGLLKDWVKTEQDFEDVFLVQLIRV